MMKKLAALLIVSLVLLSGAFALGYPIMPIGNTTPGQPVKPVISSFDINAYLSDPIVAADKFSINIYDTISMREGALGSIEATSPEAAKKKYMNMDPFIQELISTEGLAVVSFDCTGTVGIGASNSMSISLSIIDIDSTGTADTPSTGFQHVENKTVMPYDLIMKRDIAKFNGAAKTGYAVTCEPTLAGLTTPQTVYKVTATAGSKVETGFAEWTFKGTLYLKIDRQAYDNVPMGKYRTLIKMNITTGA